MRTLKLLNLHCNKTDDDNNTKVDETFLTVDNGNFQGFGPESMRNGTDWNINANIEFNVEAIVSFFNEDLIRKLSNTKYFRTYIVEENEVLKGPKGLAALGKFQETYSNVIRRLYEFYKHHLAEKEIQNKK